MEKEQKKNEKKELVHVSQVCEIFRIVSDQKGKYFITLNVYKVSERTFDTIEKAESYIEEKPWELITNTFLALLEMEKTHDKANTN